MTRKFFVYGTLRGAGIRGGMLEETEYLGEARVPGEMFSLGAFPAVRLSEDGEVVGEVFEASEKDFPGLKAQLDWVEGVAGGLYKCKEVDVLMKESGDTVSCLIYVAGPRIADGLDDHPRIESGDWLANRQS